MNTMYLSYVASTGRVLVSGLLGLAPFILPAQLKQTRVKVAVAIAQMAGAWGELGKTVSADQHRCTHCGRLFKCRSKLKEHVRAHTGERPYACTWEGCGKRFARNRDLNRHRRVHRGEKPYACGWEGCEKRFVRRDYLNEHKRVHTKEKPYVCDWPDCYKRFVTRSGLSKHRRAHRSEKSL